MPEFGSKSKNRMELVHPALKMIMNDVVDLYDITVLHNGGARTREEQAALVATGKSKTMNSKHLIQSDGYAHAIDVAPYPIDWGDKERFYFMAGMILVIAAKHDIDIRWGGDWNRNMTFDDQTFHDLPHFELAG